MLSALKRGLDNFLELITAFVMGALVVDVTWQVVTRFVLQDPSNWTEELATYLLIWVGLLGSAVALNRKAHLGIDYFVGKLDEKKRLFTEIFAFACTGSFAVAVLLIGGLQLVVETFELGQRAPATNLQLGYVYLAVPLAGFFISLYSLEFLFESIMKFKKAEG